MDADASFLLRAWELALGRKGFTSPNPPVGAVVVRQGRIIGEGAHWATGRAHAEVEALWNIDPEIARGCTVYVTLEPCCHFGKTPPCTKLLIERQVERVVFAFLDPNPAVAGKGQAELLAAGVTCEQHPTPAIDRFYASYRHWTMTGRPWAIAKLAMSIDGKTAGPGGASVELTGTEANALTHQYRRESDAILSTARTIIADDPRLNARQGEQSWSKPLYLLDRNASLPLTAKIFDTTESITIFHSREARTEALQERGVRCIAVSTDERGLDLDQVLAQIGRDGKHQLWIEAGARCFDAFASQGLLQQAFLYVAPRKLGPEALAAFDGKRPAWLERAPLTWTRQGRDAVGEVLWKHDFMVEDGQGDTGCSPE